MKEHQYGLPVHTVQFHGGSGTVLSGDPKLVKIRNGGGGVGRDGKFRPWWRGRRRRLSGPRRSIQRPAIVRRGAQPKVQPFYCPALRVAPSWCSFLDKITEELEEKDAVGGGSGAAMETIYEDYKFLTQSEIDELKIQNLMGTPFLQGYMHSFFIHVGRGSPPRRSKRRRPRST